MLCISALTRHTRRLGVVAAVVLAAGLTAAGSASAATADSATVQGRRLDIFGVPLGTATWALFGVVLLVSGLVAASRSGRRPVSEVPAISAILAESSTEAAVAVDIPVRQIRVVDSHATVSGSAATA